MKYKTVCSREDGLCLMQAQDVATAGYNGFYFVGVDGVVLPRSETARVRWEPTAAEWLAFSNAFDVEFTGSVHQHSFDVSRGFHVTPGFANKDPNIAARIFAVLCKTVAVRSFPTREVP